VVLTHNMVDPPHVGLRTVRSEPVWSRLPGRRRVT